MVKNIRLKTWWTILRVIIGLGLIVFLLWRLDLQKILAAMGGMKLHFLVYGTIAYLFFIIVSAWRWQVLLDYKKFDIRFPRTVVIYFIATFFNNLLPTTIGGDVMRVYYSMGKRRADAFATVLVDRILGFVGLFIFALGAVLYLMIRQRQTEFLLFTVIGLAAIIFITYLFFSQRAYDLLSVYVKKVTVFRLGERLNRIHEATIDFGGAWWTIIVCLIQSILIQGFLALAPYIVMKGMGIGNIGIVPFLVYVPIINVVSMIPISFNALGVREYFYILLLGRVNVSAEAAVAISLVSFFLYFVLSLTGFLCFIFYRKKIPVKQKEA
ncbi:MAG: flippase-like domain-containing protein [candidate division WOR-3 bacterium]|nr:MAG: flippase-like domain-containing protein [candidate division WOR-3 bacterium]